MPDNYYDSGLCCQYPSSSSEQEEAMLAKEGHDFPAAPMVMQAVGKDVGWHSAGGCVLQALRGQRENMRKKAGVRGDSNDSIRSAQAEWEWAGAIRR